MVIHPFFDLERQIVRLGFWSENLARLVAFVNVHERPRQRPADKGGIIERMGMSAVIGHRRVRLAFRIFYEDVRARPADLEWKLDVIGEFRRPVFTCLRSCHTCQHDYDTAVNTCKHM